MSDSLIVTEKSNQESRKPGKELTTDQPDQRAIEVNSAALRQTKNGHILMN
jgi:hypothetical protein